MTSRTPDQIAQDIIAKFAVTMPEMSSMVGTPQRKIIDIVSESISEVSLNSLLTNNMLDIDSKSGSDLEDFVGIFGFGRLQGTYAQGIVTLSVSPAATQDILIPAGSQFQQPPSSGGNTMTIFVSTVSVTLPTGSSSVDVPCRCSVIGTIGNVSSGSVTSYPAGIAVASATNTNAFSGGSDDESDENLRNRFKKTFLRNLAGTEDFYLALALQSQGTARAKVLGPVSSYTTQIQTGNTGVLVNVPSVNSKYIYKYGDAVSTDTGVPANVLTGVVTITSNTAITAPSGTFTSDMIGKYLSGTGIQSLTTLTAVADDTHATLSLAATASGTISLTLIGEAYYTNGTDYTWASTLSNTPTLTPVSTRLANTFLDVTYEYCSVNSRNDPASGKANKVDIYVDGINPTSITESFPSATKYLISTSYDTYNVGNFQNVTDSTAITAGSSLFQRLGSTPIVTYPSTIVAGSTTFVLNTDYFGVQDITTNRGTERELSGIVWKSGTSVPSAGTILRATYTYNQTPAVMNAVVKRAKQITSDVLVHQAIQKAYRFYFVIMYDQGSSISSVNANCIIAIQNYINNLAFGGWVQFSDLLQVIHNVVGVDNIRMATTADGAPYTCSEMKNGTSTGTTYVKDFQLDDDMIATLDYPADLTTMFRRRSFNTF